MYQSFHFRLIYVFTINDAKHRGCVKVGETSLGDDVDIMKALQLQPCCKELNKAAKERIDQYTKTVGLDDDVQLLHTELTAFSSKNKLVQFNDKQVHEILERSGIKKKKLGSSTEWFECGVAEVKEAIKAAKEGRLSINIIDIASKQQPIVFRPEQLDAIKLTKKRFATNNQFLWNAKMRFGKTLTALQVVKELSFDKTIIITHRPVVDEGWFDDFRKIFFDSPNYKYGSKNNCESFNSLLKLNKEHGTHFVYFASMQDLRGSEKVGGNFDKNDEIFSTDWDMLIVDEAHEGTKTALGQAVIHEIFKGNTKMLQLSGTPFNLIDDYKEEEIYTWDYVMEQRAKTNWDKTHWAEPNPYAGLPKLNIYTFDLSLELKKYQDNEHAFNFAEFFRVNENGTFKHEKDVDAFLNLLASNDAKNYPYSKLEWRQNLRHSLWTVPSVAAAAALSIKLRKHPVLGQFQVVNVAGEGDTDADYESNNALEMVKEAIGPNPEETMTITLSRGRLTTGVTVPAWTAVFMLHGSYSTDAKAYMQTIFRAQSPAVINGRVKEECFVFDFAPDRTLKVLAETAKVSAKAGKSKSNDKVILGEFLNFCPVISFHGAQMQAISVDHMMQQLKRVYVDRVVRNGFEDSYLYNDRLFQLNHLELEKFARLRDIIGQTKAMKHTDEVDVNNQGFTEEEYEEIERIKKKNKAQLTMEELQKLQQVEEKKKQRHTAISILRGISIRMPMILYGADIQDEKTEITLENFTELIDDQSWEEFMPKGVTKELFREFIPYYDEDIFSASGLRIRSLTREADTMDIEERIERITTIFTSFRNPDKETVLTPWRVVNLHMSVSLGGWCFYDDEYNERLCSPYYVDKGQVTKDTLSEISRVLEINSKSGLYPLYVAYSIYRNIIDREQMSYMVTDAAVADRIAHHHRVWDKVLHDNIFIICKTPMAKSITRRTLAGFRGGVKVNARYFEDLINQISNKKDKFVKQVASGAYWNKKDIQNMKFNAVVGNPPYQGDGSSQIYPLFYLLSRELGNYSSLIFPTGWQKPCASTAKGLARLNKEEIKADKQIRKIEIFHDVFPGVSGAAEVNVVLWQKDHDNELYGLQYVYEDGKGPQEVQLRWDLNDLDKPAEIKSLSSLVKLIPGFIGADTITSGRSPYGLNTDAFKDAVKNGLEAIVDEQPKEIDDIRIYGKLDSLRTIRYIRKTYKLPKIKEYVQNTISKYKVFIPYAWGNMSENVGLGGAYSDILVAEPREICTQTYVVSGCFDTKDEAIKHAKYILTPFARALLYAHKQGRTSAKPTWQDVPIQDYTESWWGESIEQINEHLFDKYDVPQNVRDFVNKNIQPRSEENIRNM